MFLSEFTEIVIKGCGGQVGDTNSVDARGYKKKNKKKKQEKLKLYNCSLNQKDAKVSRYATQAKLCPWTHKLMLDSVGQYVYFQET